MIALVENPKAPRDDEQHISQVAEVCTDRHATLLVVDDNEMNRDMLGRRMQRSGYSVVSADSGAQALEIVAGGGIDLILLDIEMPEMSGLEVLARVRRAYGPTELPVIMVTARAASEYVVRALSGGANDYVTKPVDIPVARARVKTQLSLKFAEQAVRESEERYALAARGSNDGLWDWDLVHDEVYFSPRWFSILGIEGTSPRNSMSRWEERVHPADLAGLKAGLAAHLAGTSKHFESEHRLMHGDGDYRWVLSRGLAIRDTAGMVTRMAGSLTDVTGTKVLDPLTGLPNRLLLDDRLERSIVRLRGDDKERFALVLVDVDRFRFVNDSLGPGMGDRLLTEISRRLTRLVKEHEHLAHNHRPPTVARLAGDEFVVLLEGMRRSGDAALVAEAVLAELGRVFEFATEEIHLRASAGVVACSSAETSPADVLRDAAMVLHRAKRLGGGRYVVFEESMREEARHRLDTENALRHAIERNEMRVHYQPIVNLTDGEILGFEALVRWDRDGRGLISPADFIPVAEETGLIVPIGNWVLREACRQAGEWQQTHPRIPPQMVSVNLSAKQMREPGLVDFVRDTLAETGLDPRQLKLELTESLVVEKTDHVIATLGKLRELGVEVAIDDFGTGYSSFAYLQDLPIDRIKIDRSFVNRVGSDHDTQEIVRSLVELASNLGMDVVAEGVETIEEAEMLMIIGCELCQGFLYSRPQDASAATRQLTQGRIVPKELEPDQQN